MPNNKGTIRLSVEATEAVLECKRVCDSLAQFCSELVAPLRQCGREDLAAGLELNVSKQRDAWSQFNATLMRQIKDRK